MPKSNSKSPSESRHVKVLVLGSGPAGLSAALYAARAELAPVVLTGTELGGQAALTYAIENYPGFPDGVGGAQLGELFQKQAERFGAQVEFGSAQSVDLSRRPFRVVTDNDEILADTLIVATGARPNHLEVPGESLLTGMGISYCATCDGAFFKDQEVAVIGGGDTALEDALYLSRLARKVYVIHRRDQLRAQKILQRKASEAPQIEFVWNTVVKEIRGEGVVKTLLLEDLKQAKQRELAVSGAFIAVGQRPNTDLCRGLVELDEKGYIITDQDCATSVAGIFAAGDCRKKGLRQITTAVGDGALAAAAAERYIERKP